MPAYSRPLQSLIILACLSTAVSVDVSSVIASISYCVPLTQRCTYSIQYSLMTSSKSCESIWIMGFSDRPLIFFSYLSKNTKYSSMFNSSDVNTNSDSANLFKPLSVQRSVLRITRNSGVLKVSFSEASALQKPTLICILTILSKFKAPSRSQSLYSLSYEDVVELQLKNTLSMITWPHKSFNFTRVVFDSHAAFLISKHFCSTQSNCKAIGVFNILQDSVKSKFKKSLNNYYPPCFKKSMNCSSRSLRRLNIILMIDILKLSLSIVNGCIYY